MKSPPFHLRRRRCKLETINGAVAIADFTLLSHNTINLVPVNNNRGEPLTRYSYRPRNSSNKMNMNIVEFNAQELCSRKLWQMVNTTDDKSVSKNALQQAIDELTTRRHYLAQLRETGKLGGL